MLSVIKLIAIKENTTVNKHQHYPPHRYPTRSQTKLIFIHQKTVCGEMNAVLDATTGDMLEYHDLIKGPDKEIWDQAFENTLRRLAQGGENHIKEINKIKFISKDQVL